MFISSPAARRVAGLLRQQRQQGLRRALLLAAAAGLLSVVAAPAASAHSSDPRIVTVLDDVQPPLPAGVVVQIRANLAAQVVAENSTASELVVLARGGEPFLKLSRAGVFANLESPDFYETSNPNGSSGATPERVQRSGGRLPPRFVRISPGDSWGWYDHRLHPAVTAVPSDQRQSARLGDFVVPMTYAGAPLQLVGHVQFRPLLGGFQSDVDPAPAGLTAQVLQGRLPGVFLSVAPGVTATVLGVDDQPFLRFGSATGEVNTASRTYVEDRAARGQEIPPAAATPRWQPLEGRSYTWLDARLRYASEDPPAAALRAAGPTVVSRWEVPVLVGTARTALTGDVRWVPDPGAVAATVSKRPVRSARLPLGLGAAAVLALLLVGAAVVVRRRRAS